MWTLSKITPLARVNGKVRAILRESTLSTQLCPKLSNWQTYKYNVLPAFAFSPIILGAFYMPFNVFFATHHKLSAGTFSRLPFLSLF